MDDQILAGRSARHKLIRLRATHRARRRLNDQKLYSATREDLLIRFALIGKRLVESGAIHVKCVRVFHDERTHAYQSRLRPRLVAKLDLNLVPNLRRSE